jgi:peptidoglycan/LPS O-acetylase OafA/YrhL
MLISNLIKQRLDTSFMRFLAVVLVVNSHLDTLYPSNLSYFASGGAIGNSLFFFLSGFGLWYSVHNLKSYTFTQWIGKRFLRIYTPYIIVVPALIGILIYMGDLNLDNIITIGEIVFFPHQAYWFLQAIILYYILIYFLFSIWGSSDRSIFLFIVAFLTLYLYFYFYSIDLAIFSIESLPFKLIYYFLCILLGMVASNKIKEAMLGCFSSFVCVISSLLAFLVLKIKMQNGIGYEYQILQHIAVLCLVFSLFSLSRTLFVPWLRKLRLVSQSIDFIADHSLEIYLVHLPLVFLLRYLNLTSSLYILPLVVCTLVLSRYVKIFSERALVRLELIEESV